MRFKISGLLAGILLLGYSLAWGSGDQKTYADSTLGASGSRYLYIDAPYATDWPQVDYVTFFVKITSPSGTITGTVEMQDGTDIYNLDFFLISASTASGNSITTTGNALNTAGNYIIAVRLADFGNAVIGRIRLKIATASASGVTVGGKSLTYSTR